MSPEGGKREGGTGGRWMSRGHYRFRWGGERGGVLVAKGE